jgi:hypothetical protein
MNQEQTQGSEEVLSNISHDRRAAAQGLSDVPVVCAILRIHRLAPSKQMSEFSLPPHYEFKRDVFPGLAALGPSRDSANVRSIVERHGSQIVGGKIPLQDVRIERKNPHGEMAGVDLELATEHRRSCNLTQEVRAGFSVDVRSQEVGGLRRVLDQRELTAGILSR